jgi:hypothetical protein
MFAQVIQGHVSDAAEARTAFETWMHELAPSATGWLGTTAGVTADGTLIAVARFESEDAARRNSDRHEQDQWWAQTSKLFTGEATFADSTDVMVDMVGDPDKAGFVQVMRGRSKDPQRARELMNEDSTDWAAFRPEILGSVSAAHDGGAYTMVMYFTSEQQAREGEKKELPPELQAQMDQMNALSDGMPEFFDVKDPWLYAPK